MVNDPLGNDQSTPGDDAPKARPATRRTAAKKAPVKAPASAARPASGKPSRRNKGAALSIFRDPTVRLMGFVAVGLVVFYLIVIISSILVGVLANSQPKTMVERDLSRYKEAIEAGSVDEEVWAGYATALMSMGQDSAAQRVLNDAKARKVEDNQKRRLYLVQSQLYYKSEEYKKALDTANAGMDLLEEQLKTDIKNLYSGGDPTELTATKLPEQYWFMVTIVAQSYEGLGKDKDAIEALNYYILNKPTAADIIEWRGDVYARMGEKDKALADFENAIRFAEDDAATQRIQDKIDGVK